MIQDDEHLEWMANEIMRVMLQQAIDSAFAAAMGGDWDSADASTALIRDLRNDECRAFVGAAIKEYLLREMCEQEPDA